MLVQFGNMLVGDGKSRRLGMTAKTLEKVGACGLKRLNDIKILRSTRGTTTDLAPLAQYKGGAARLVGQLARDQPDNTFGPLRLLAIDENDLLIGLEFSLSAHTLHQLFGLLLTRGIQIF